MISLMTVYLATVHMEKFTRYKQCKARHIYTGLPSSTYIHRQSTIFCSAATCIVILLALTHA